MAEVQSSGGGSGPWPFRTWQFWCGLLAGAGIGLLTGAALVELELLTLHSKAWVSLLGIVLFGSAGILGARGKRT
jgi:hypothetical protein